jgi:hypothetical protein
MNVGFRASAPVRWAAHLGAKRNVSCRPEWAETGTAGLERATVDSGRLIVEFAHGSQRELPTSAVVPWPMTQALNIGRGWYCGLPRSAPPPQTTQAAPALPRQAQNAPDHPPAAMPSDPAEEGKIGRGRTAHNLTSADSAALRPLWESDRPLDRPQQTEHRREAREASACKQREHRAMFACMREEQRGKCGAGCLAKQTR